MRSTRRFIGVGATAAGLCVVFSLALTPAAALAASHPHKPAAGQSAPVDAATPSAACTNARQALLTANAKDRTEDGAEKKNAKQTSDAAAKSEDRDESKALKPLKDAVRSACTTPACLAAEKAQKDSHTGDATEDKSEKTKSTEKSKADQAEDKGESATQKKQKDARRAACSSSSK